MDTERARKQLLSLLADLDRSAKTLREERPGGSDELANYDQHPADAATNLSDADRAEALVEATDRQRAQVQEALQRIEDGAYGSCVNCGRTLPDERLEARPEAARCIECQEQLEAGV